MKTVWSGNLGHLALRVSLAVALLLGLCLACFGCGDPSFGADVEAEMEQAIELAMADNKTPGAIVGVWVPGWGTWVHAEGTADLTTGREIRPADKVRIASITKTFTATVILQLVDEGTLSLDDTVDRWAPEVPYSDQITIRQVCNHTSGIYSMTEDEDFDKALLDDPLRKWTFEEMLEVALKHDPYFPPGEGWHYSDTGYELLGVIIENVTGNDIEQEIQERVVEELGLTNTSFPYGPEMTGNYSYGYVERDGILVDYTETDPSAPWAGGGDDLQPVRPEDLGPGFGQRHAPGPGHSGGAADMGGYARHGTFRGGIWTGHMLIWGIRRSQRRDPRIQLLDVLPAFKGCNYRGNTQQVPPRCRKPRG
jgi:CubicO group peptidase (beta-lactamase class C family)